MIAFDTLLFKNFYESFKKKIFGVFLLHQNMSDLKHIFETLYNEQQQLIYENSIILMNIIICMSKKFVFNDGFAKINNEKLINAGIMLMRD